MHGNPSGSKPRTGGVLVYLILSSRAISLVSAPRPSSWHGNDTDGSGATENAVSLSDVMKVASKFAYNFTPESRMRMSSELSDLQARKLAGGGDLQAKEQNESLEAKVDERVPQDAQVVKEATNKTNVTSNFTDIAQGNQTNVTSDTDIAQGTASLGAEIVGGIPSRVWQACGTLVALSWFWMAENMYRDPIIAKTSYEILHEVSESEIRGSGSPRWQLWIAAFSYWIVMPLVTLYFGMQSTCEDGPPNASYKVYAGFLALQLMVAASLSSYLGRPPILTYQIMKSLPVLCAFMVLEHFDSATDSIFIGSTEACNQAITAQWLASWKAMPVVGHLAADICEQMHFGGLALSLYVTGAYLPQLLCLASPFAVGFLVINMAIIVAWVKFGCLIAAPIMGLSFLAFRFRTFWSIRMIWERHIVATLQTDYGLAVWSAMLIWEDDLVKDSELIGNIHGEGRPLAIGLTRLAQESLLQLWLQSSFFSLSFDLTTMTAKFKGVLSMGLGFLVALSKLGPIYSMFFAAVRDNVRPNEGWLQIFWSVMPCILFLIFVGLLALSIPLKVYFAFVCESHVWNLSTGCVELG